MGLAFYSSTNPSAQWRGPLGLGLLFPAVCLLALPFLPESPRWLLLHGQKDKARKVVFALHAMSGDPDHTYATEEFFQMEKQAEIDVALDASWIELFRKPAYRKRVILAVGFAFFSQCAGSLVINNYACLPPYSCRKLEQCANTQCVGSNIIQDLGFWHP